MRNTGHRETYKEKNSPAGAYDKRRRRRVLVPLKSNCKYGQTKKMNFCSKCFLLSAPFGLISQKPPDQKFSGNITLRKIFMKLVSK